MDIKGGFDGNGVDGVFSIDEIIGIDDVIVGHVNESSEGFLDDKCKDRLEKSLVRKSDVFFGNCLEIAIFGFSDGFFD